MRSNCMFYCQFLLVYRFWCVDLTSVTTALEASEKRAQRRRPASFGEQISSSRSSTPPVGNCTTTCEQIRWPLSLFSSCLCKLSSAGKHTIGLWANHYSSNAEVCNTSVCFHCLIRPIAFSRQDLAECRTANESLRRELSACQERAIRQREASDVNERRLQEQLNRTRKLVVQTRARAEKLAYLHAALAADRRSAADLITTLQWVNSRYSLMYVR